LRDEKKDKRQTNRKTDLGEKEINTILTKRGKRGEGRLKKKVCGEKGNGLITESRRQSLEMVKRRGK